MKTLAWKDLKHKASPEERERIKREAIDECDRMGFASLRKARQRTQAELADKLGIDQASVPAIENRSDLPLSTLPKYVRAWAATSRSAPSSRKRRSTSNRS